MGIVACSILLSVIFGVTQFSAAEDSVRTPAEIRATVDGLQREEVAWRKVLWRTCLIDGLNESRRTGKPLVLWIFIDRPIDDERC
jgi:hypothetical protein